jgi:hypothetical protein
MGHETPDFPEQLLAGRETVYFRYFLDRDTFSDADVGRYARAYAASKHCVANVRDIPGFSREQEIQCGTTKCDRRAFWGWRQQKTRLSRNSCRASPQLCGLRVAQMSSSRWLRTACIRVEEQTYAVVELIDPCPLITTIAAAPGTSVAELIVNIVAKGCRFRGLPFDSLYGGRVR